MATIGHDNTHLLQEKLTNPIIPNLLDEFGAWVKDARFESSGDVEVCRDEGLNKASESLRSALELVRRFGAFRFGWTVLRIPGPFPSAFKNTPGFACIIPIRIWSGSPDIWGVFDPQIATGTISPHKLLIPGWITHMTKPVKISPGLDCLFIAQVYDS